MEGGLAWGRPTRLADAARDQQEGISVMAWEEDADGVSENVDGGGVAKSV